MISLDLARRLARAGIPWTPAAGDRFVVPDRDLDDVVFEISDMVVEVRDHASGRSLHFNGTTEWALDSIEQGDVLWLPREGQLRALLGAAFLSLQATPEGFVVEIEVEVEAGVEADGGAEVRCDRHVDSDAECAYARAVLALHPGC